MDYNFLDKIILAIECVLVRSLVHRQGCADTQ